MFNTVKMTRIIPNTTTVALTRLVSDSVTNIETKNMS